MYAELISKMSPQNLLKGFYGNQNCTFKMHLATYTHVQLDKETERGKNWNLKPITCFYEGKKIPLILPWFWSNKIPGFKKVKRWWVLLQIKNVIFQKIVEKIDGWWKGLKNSWKREGRRRWILPSEAIVFLRNPKSELVWWNFYDMEEVMTKLFGAIERKKHRDLDIYLQRTIESFDEGKIALILLKLHLTIKTLNLNDYVLFNDSNENFNKIFNHKILDRYSNNLISILKLY